MLLLKKNRNDFRRHMLSVIGYTPKQWTDYWQSMVTFRNKFVAHRIASGLYPIIPQMDIALLVASTYDNWFRQNINAIFYEPSLQERYDRLIRTSQETFKDLVILGPSMINEYEGRIPG